MLALSGRRAVHSVVRQNGRQNAMSLLTAINNRHTNAAVNVSPASSSYALSAFRSTAGARRELFLRPSPIVCAANPQAGKPASDNVGHMIRNVKEEASGVRASVESAVAGGQTGELLGDAKSVLGEMSHQVPRPALLWGSLGIIPYISTAGASIYLARQAQLVSQGLASNMDFETATALLLHAENVQITFGAILLSFLGAIHWGFEFSKYGGEVGNRRYVLGLVPIACAWPTLILDPQMALICQWAAFVLTWFIDLRATSAGWVPKWYSSYRFGLSLAVGTSIIATLAGTSYYDSDQSRATSSGVGRRLQAVTAEAAEKASDSQEHLARGQRGTKQIKQKVGGDVIADSSDEERDSFVQISNPKRKEEERKKKEEEEKKKKEEEAKKKKEEAEKKGGEGEKEKKKDGEEEEEGKKDDDDDDGGDDDGKKDEGEEEEGGEDK